MDVNQVISLKDKAETFFKSRWSGLLLGPTYGVLLYLYISYMILHGLPFTPDHMDFSVSEQDYPIMTCLCITLSVNPLIFHY